MTRRANRKKRLTVLYIVEHPNQEGDTCIDWTSQYCWTNGWNCLWRGHSVYRNRPLIPLYQVPPDPLPATCYLFVIPESSEKVSLILSCVKQNIRDGSVPPTFWLDSWEDLAHALSRIPSG